MGGGEATIWDGNIAAAVFCICLTRPYLYLSSLPTFVFVSLENICICLLFPLLYLSEQVTFVFVSPNYSCICLLIPLLHFLKLLLLLHPLVENPRYW